VNSLQLRKGVEGDIEDLLALPVCDLISCEVYLMGWS
jgi:hypothetical protein